MNRPGDRQLLDRDHEEVSSLLEDALGQRLGSHNCVRSFSGESFGGDPADPAMIDFGAEPSVLNPTTPPPDYLSIRGWKSVADKNAQQARVAIRNAERLGVGGLGDPTNFDVSGKVAPAVVNGRPPATAGASGGFSLKGASILPTDQLTAGIAGALLGGVFLGPVGALLGGGIGWFLGR